MEYSEEDFLSIRGLQHFAFCRRRWALIQIEQQWQDNVLTVEGGHLHERAHDILETEKRGDLLISRGMPVRSRELGVNGVCDVVEFHADKTGVSLFGREGNWLPVPVEYKRGSPMPADESDSLQLCCQAMCLEEMLLCPPVSEAYLYYCKTAHRLAVTLDSALRDRVAALLKEMHALYHRRHTPHVRPTKACRSCSLNSLCLPRLDRIGSAEAYLKKRLEELP